MTDQTHMQLVDWLDDLTVRFLLNLPASELSSMPRLCFQVEEAQWFYEDFIRPMSAAAGNILPSLGLRQFCLLLFQHCPLLRGFPDSQLLAAYDAFLAYKVRVPVRGAILMTHDMDKLLLVKGWKKGSSWSFPRGKINQEEKDLDCAIREVYEETGYDVRQTELFPANENIPKYIDVTIREQHVRLFVFRGIPENTHFEPKTRKEISDIKWYNVRDLPGFRKEKQGGEQATPTNKFYMVAPFMGPLKKWINQQKRCDAAALANRAAEIVPEEDIAIRMPTEMRLSEIVEDRSEELKRLLSIGGNPEPPTSTSQDTLLALFKNAKLRPSPNQSPTPLHPHNAFDTQLSLDQVRVPSYASSQQHNLFQPPINRSALPSMTSNLYSSNPQPQTFQGLSPMRAHEQPVSLPALGPSQQLHEQHGSSLPEQATNFVGWPQPTSYLHSQQQSRRAHSRPVTSDVQDSHGIIGSAPDVPNAENLPIPKLNAHAMTLLNAFKSVGSSDVGDTAANINTHMTSGTHQNALLGLFKSTTAGKDNGRDTDTLPPADGRHESKIESLPRTGTRLQEAFQADITSEKIVVDEVIRSPIPVQTNSKVTKRSKERLSQSQARGGPDPAAINGRKHTHLAPAGSATSPRPISPVKIVQRPDAKYSRSPNLSVSKSQSPRRRQTQSPRQTNNGKRSELRAPSTQFTILARPGSSRELPNTADQAEKTAFLPQVLKRPESRSGPQEQIAIAPTTTGVSQDPVEKKDKLLALFGKSLSPATTSSNNVSKPSISPPPSELSHATTVPALNNVPTTGEARKTNLLNLLAGASKASTPGIPSQVAPTIALAKAHSSQTTARPPLDPFSKSTASASTDINGPTTPISPFDVASSTRKNETHSSPWASTLPHPHGRQSDNSFLPAIQTRETKSRLSSITSAIDDVTSPVGSGHATPTEAKGFLLEYLNGVVQKEAYRNKK